MVAQINCWVGGMAGPEVRDSGPVAIESVGVKKLGESGTGGLFCLRSFKNIKAHLRRDGL